VLQSARRKNEFNLTGSLHTMQMGFPIQSVCVLCFSLRQGLATKPRQAFSHMHFAGILWHCLVRTACLAVSVLAALAKLLYRVAARNTSNHNVILLSSSKHNVFQKSLKVGCSCCAWGTQACMQQCMPYLISALSTGKARGTQASKVVLCAMEDELASCCWCNMWPMSWLS